MKNQISRMKDLINYNYYGYITEEMGVSSDFMNNVFQEYKELKTVALEVGVDPENDIEYRIFLMLSFTNKDGYDELVFGFSLLDKNNQYVKGKESIYSRTETDKYLPKQLKGSIIIFNKLKEMFKKLMTMEKPNVFFMETYEDFVSERLLNPYRNLIPIIIQNGYVMESEGLSHDKKKYHWKFVQKTKQQIKESKEFEKFINNRKKDDAYWQYRKELTMSVVDKIIENEEKNKKKLI